GLSSLFELQPSPAWRTGVIVAFTLVTLAITFAISADAISLLFATLTIMLYLLVPWTAVNLVDYFFVRRGRYAITQLLQPHGIYGTWAPRGLA
ncbi:cytosine permease, partial [Pseudomonas sp. MPR-R5B]|uniref:cytosine permease n=1 Tax=Pseudomonas sp. MPR-R5B TaxID=2070630 RepID=UPI001570F0A5